MHKLKYWHYYSTLVVTYSSNVPNIVRAGFERTPSIKIQRQFIKRDPLNLNPFYRICTDRPLNPTYPFSKKGQMIWRWCMWRFNGSRKNWIEETLPLWSEGLSWVFEFLMASMLGSMELIKIIFWKDHWGFKLEIFKFLMLI
jgi:hypothetical protein